MTAADLSIFHPDRAGEQNADERAYHGWLCSLDEGPDYSEDGFVGWWIRCRAAGFDESVHVEQCRSTLRLRAYTELDEPEPGEPPNLTRAALSFVREQPECRDNEP